MPFRVSNRPWNCISSGRCYWYYRAFWLCLGGKGGGTLNVVKLSPSLYSLKLFLKGPSVLQHYKGVTNLFLLDKQVVVSVKFKQVQFFSVHFPWQIHYNYYGMWKSESSSVSRCLPFLRIYLNISLLSQHFGLWINISKLRTFSWASAAWRAVLIWKC